MSDHTALWFLFALLSVLFVLVVVTARRGPWQRPPAERPLVLRGTKGQLESVRHIRYVVGVDPAGGPDDSRIVILRQPATDLMWGKNPPPWS